MTGLEEIQDEIQKLRKQHGSSEATSSTDPDEAILQLSRLLTSELISRMQIKLPREIRDMIYEQLYVGHKEPWTSLGQLLEIPGTRHECSKKVSNDDYGCFANGDLPHYVDPKFIGNETFVEVIEALYNLPPGKAFNPFEAHWDEIETMTTYDSFHIGLNPAEKLKQLTVSFFIDELMHRDQRNMDREATREHFNVLRKIINKNGFRLRINVFQRRIRMRIMEDFVEAIAPIIQDFDSNGADVRVTFHYVDNDKVNWSLTDAAKNPGSDWKPGVYEYLREKEWDIDGDTEYLFEDDESYDPAEYWDQDQFRRPWDRSKGRSISTT